MIESLSITNYKNLAHLELKDLRRFVLVAGENGVGKTNLLEALYFFQNIRDEGCLLKIWRQRGMDRVPTNRQFFVDFIFPNYGTKQRTMRIDIHRHGLPPEFHESLDVSLDDASVEIRSYRAEGDPTPPPTPTAFTERWPSLKCQISRQDAFETALLGFVRRPDGSGACRFLMPVKYAPPEALLVSLKPTIEEEASRIGDVDLNNDIESLTRWLRIVEPRVADISTLPHGGMNAVYCDVGLGQKVPLRLLGEGAVRLLNLLCAVMRPAGSLALLDEFDNGFHHSVKSKAMQALMDCAQANDTQIICTTHSYECLQKAVEAFQDEKYRNDFCFIRLEKRADGEIAPVYLTYENLEGVIEAGWEVR